MTGPRRGQTVPTVLIRARGKISSCDSTAVPGFTRSTIARTWARIAPLLNTTGIPPAAGLFVNLVQLAHEFLQLAGAIASCRSSGGPTIESANAASQSGDKVSSGI